MGKEQNKCEQSCLNRYPATGLKGMKVWIGQSLLLLSQKMEKVANDSNNNNNYCTNKNCDDNCNNNTMV